MRESHAEHAASIRQSRWKIDEEVIESRLIFQRQLWLGASFGRRRRRSDQLRGLFGFNFFELCRSCVQAIALPVDFDDGVLSVRQKRRLHFRAACRDGSRSNARQEVVRPRPPQFGCYAVIVVLKGGTEGVARSAALGIDVASGTLSAH